MKYTRSAPGIPAIGRVRSHLKQEGTLYATNESAFAAVSFTTAILAAHDASTEEMPVEVTYTLEPADYTKFYSFLFQRQVPLYMQVGLPILLVVPVIYVLLTGGNPLTSPVPVMGLALILVLWLGKREALKAPMKQPPQIEERTIRLTATGVQQETSSGLEETSWAGIIEIVKTTDYICLFVTPQTAYVIPVRVFADPTSAEDFYATAQRYWQENHS